MPKVSVLMPVYNTKEEYLREAMESILNQTFTDFELLICDDGSKNQDTLNVLDYYKTYDKRIKIYYEKHIGLVKIRNKLLNLASGEYLAIMDSDDISLPHRLETEVNFLDNNIDISIVGSWYECFPKLQIVKTLPSPKILDLVQGNCFGHSTIMFRNEEIKKYNLKYNEKYEASHDYGLFAEAIFKMKCANIQQVLVKYRVHPNNISHMKAELQQNNAKKIQQSMLEHLTTNKEIQTSLINLMQPKCILQKPCTFLQNIFSVTNEQINNKVYKKITIFWFKIKFKIKKNNKVNYVKDNFPIRLSDEERKFLINNISTAKRYLEFGSGGSTFLALIETSIENITSVESDKKWLEHLEKWQIISENINKRLRFLHIDIGKTGEWGIPIELNRKELFPSYSKKAFLSGVNYDVIFIDGRFRVACAIQAILNSSKDTKIIIHDFINRPQYHVILDYTDIVDTVDSMVLLKIKENYNINQLIQLYEKYKYIYE